MEYRHCWRNCNMLQLHLQIMTITEEVKSELLSLKYRMVNNINFNVFFLMKMLPFTSKAAS